MLQKKKIFFESPIDNIGYYLTGRFIDSQTDKNLIRSIKKGFEGFEVRIGYLLV